MTHSQLIDQLRTEAGKPLLSDAAMHECYRRRYEPCRWN
jgi:hypothetical protein